jgi:trk system potassium uptake protein TrkA
VRRIEAVTGARVAFLSRYTDGVLVTGDTVLQENDVLHVLMRDEDAATVERLLTHAPDLKED